MSIDDIRDAHRARISLYESLELDFELLAMADERRARRQRDFGLADTWHSAAARSAAEAGAYGRKADELRAA